MVQVFLRMKFFLSIVFGLLLISAIALAADAPKSAAVAPAAVAPAGAPSAGAPAAPVAVLPNDFAGWRVSGAVTKSADPALVDAANAAVLKEYGFERFEKAEYTRDDGGKLAIKAALFDDASGAFGAFTYYQTSVMLDESIGEQAGSLNNRVLFFHGNVLVDALFDRLTVMSAAELRELAGLLPNPAGSAGKLPSLRAYLPARGYQKGTTKYIMGPMALDRIGAPLPSAMVDFKSGAEVILGKYSATAGDSTVMLIAYPTPQIAAERLRQIDAAHQVTAQQPGVASIVDVGPFFDKRTGPIVAIAAGPLSQSEAREILGSIGYEADVTWNQNTFATKRDNLANLLFNVIVLCGIVVALALVAGVGFGGVRILMKRFFPGRVFDRSEEMEFITDAKAALLSYWSRGMLNPGPMPFNE